MKTCVLFILIFIINISAWAHPMDLGYVQFDQRTEAFSIQMNSLATLVFSNTKPTEHFRNQIEKNIDQVMKLILGKISATSGAQDCGWKNAKLGFINQSTDSPVEIKANLSCPKENTSNTQSINMNFGFLNRNLPNYKILGRINDRDEEQSFIADLLHPSVTLKISKEFGFIDFIEMGISHIGAHIKEWKSPEGWQWPAGIDHILFILALLLGGGSFSGLLKSVTGFTLGHSITLAIASMNLIQVSSKWIEVLIALTIVYVALEAVFLKRSRHKWQLTILFGLVHGFGFASAITDLHLSNINKLNAIIGFNFGVELGQLLIIAVIAPALFLLRRSPNVALIASRTGGAGIAAAGVYLVIIRTLT